MPVEEGSGEERGDVKAPPSFGECVVTVLSVGGELWSGAGAILRFLVEAVLKLGRLPWSRWSSRARQKSVWRGNAVPCQRTTAKQRAERLCGNCSAIRAGEAQGGECEEKAQTVKARRRSREAGV
jgi:hypothetical protein